MIHELWRNDKKLHILNVEIRPNYLTSIIICLKLSLKLTFNFQNFFFHYMF